MQTAHAIRGPAPAECQIRHIKIFRRVGRVLAAQSQQIVNRNAQLLFCISPEILLDEGRSKTVETGGHRRVRGEQIARPRHRQCDFEGLPCFFHEASRAFQHGERRVPFVQMTDLRLHPQRAQHPPSADPQKQFLLEAQFRPAPVEFAGDPPMRGIVRGVVAVQQVQLHTAHLDLPCAQPDRVSRQRDLQPQPLPVRLAQRRDRQLSGVVVRVEGLLRSVLADYLAKIALLVEQAYAGHRHTQVAGSLELIAGHITKPARVDGQSLAQHEFHAEISGAGQRRLRVILLKPRGRLRLLPPGFHQFIHLLTESGVV